MISAVPDRRWPVLTLTVTSAVLVLNVAGALHPPIAEGLRRQPSMVENGEVWRFVTAFFVQTDPQWQSIATFMLLAGAGTLAERLHSRVSWIASLMKGG